MNNSEPFSKYKNINLSEFGPIIKNYWIEFEQIEKESYSPLSGLTIPEHDFRAIRLIQALKRIEPWKSNLFILNLHYKKVTELARILNVKRSSLSVYLCNIKKEIKSLC